MNNLNINKKNALLDSSLILETFFSKQDTFKNIYNVKIVNCDNYLQVYKLNDYKIKKSKIENNLKKNILNIDTDNLKKIDNKIDNKIGNYVKIENKNLIRSKLSCQRLAKCNCNIWKSFITLTFDCKKFSIDLKDVSITNYEFKKFIIKIRKKFKEFKYIAVPEFHKSGIVHYHMLCNVGIENTDLIYQQKDNKKFFHIKYWNCGFDSVEFVFGDIKKIVGYISKYMTKDTDNRLFTKHRYLYSRNLNKPSISYLNLSNKKHLDYFNKMLEQKKLIYNNIYQNSYNEDLISFEEYLKT